MEHRELDDVDMLILHFEAELQDMRDGFDAELRRRGWPDEQRQNLLARIEALHDSAHVETETVLRRHAANRLARGEPPAPGLLH